MANKKINQLVAKTTIQSTDLFPLGDASTGQLFKKTIAELQAAIGGAVISVNGLVGTVVLDTDDIQELGGATNRYFTDARARAAISLTVSGNSGASTYSNSTGVLNVPTYTLAGLGGITATFLSGASGIAYNSSTGVITYTGTVFTDASIRALVSAGAGLSYNSSTGVFSYSGTVYTDASIRALISLTTSGTSGASTYNNTTGVLNVPTYTLAGLGGIGAGFLSGGAGITYNSSTGVIASTITQYTDALARASISAGTGISYNSGTGVITYNGTVYTDSSIRNLLSGGTAITYNSSTGAISYSGTVYNDSSVRALLSGTAPITYNSTTGAIGITQASTSANGFLSSTDWNTFNGKQNALTLGNITEVNSNVFMFPDGGTGKTIGNFSIQMIQAGATYNGYLSSTDWTTFNNKQATITGGATTIVSSNLTTNRALISNGSGKVDISSVTSTELGYLSGVTSAIQTQLNAKQGTISLTTTGTSGVATLSSGTLNIPNYGTALSGYLPLTGGTLTGALGGTSASFSSSVTGTSFSINSNGTISSNGFWGTLHTKGAGSFSDWSIINSGGNGIMWNPTGTLNISFGGSATISSSVTAGTYLMSLGQLPAIIPSSTFADYLSTNIGRFAAISNATNTYPTIVIAQYSSNGSLGRDAIYINSDGNIGFGTNTPNNYGSTTVTIASTTDVNNAGLAIRNSTGGLRGSFYTDGASAIIVIGSATNHAVTFVSNDTERGRVTNGGNWLLGTSTDNGERLYVSGSIRATGSITANSDVRLKKNIERIENALQKVSEISGYTYNTIYDEDRHAGVIAQEIDKVLPEIVNKGNDGLMGVEYGNISALLIEAIKEQKVLIESLQAKVEALKK
jgi:hypothetical protein